MTMVMSKLNILKSYKANTSSIVTAVIDEDTGEEKKRLINSTRWKGYGPVAIYYHENKVPDKPSAPVEEQRDKADKKLLKRLEEVRPSSALTYL